MTHNYIYGQWIAMPVCVLCETELLRIEEYHSNGVCPYCGHDAHATICETKNIVRRNVYEPVKLLGFIPWKKFVTTETK
jgi:predicted RNA-binding Zn-ribbon protein involved in translation (DUF1610 family)